MRIISRKKRKPRFTITVPPSAEPTTIEVEYLGVDCHGKIRFGLGDGCEIVPEKEAVIDNGGAIVQDSK